MFFGMFGSIFLLSQFFQTVQGYSPLGSGLRILPWTAMPIFVAPIAGALSDRVGGQRLMGVGLALQAIGLAWIASVSTPTRAVRGARRARSSLAGVGMALFFAPVANVVLSARAAAGGGPGVGCEQRDPRARRRLRRRRARVDLRPLRRLRERPRRSRDGMNAAVYVGAALVALGAVAAFAIPGKRRRADEVGVPALEARLDQSSLSLGVATAIAAATPASSTKDERSPSRLRDGADDRRSGEEAEVADRRHGGDGAAAVCV